MKKIITFLGIKPIETAYQYQGAVYHGKVFAEAMHQFLDFDEMLVFVTEAALQSAYPVLQNLNDERIHPVEIPIGETTDEMWQIFASLTDAVDEKDTVIFDITHGLRSLPFLVFLAAAFLKSAKNVTIEAIYYGAFELSKDAQGNPRPAPVIDLSNFVDLLDWLNASDQFIRTGNATSLAGLLRQSKPKYDPQNKQVYQSGKPLGEAADALDDVSLALRLILPDRAMQASEKLQTKMGVAASSIQKYAMPFTVLAEQISATYTPLALPNPRSTDNVIASLVRERNLIEWYLQRNQIVQAVSVAREWLVSWGMIQVGYRNLYDKSKRTKERLEDNVIVEGIEEVFGKSLAQKMKTGTFDDHVFDTGVRLKDIHQINEVLDLYNDLGRVRNILAHAGKQLSDESAETLEKQVRKFCNQLKQLPLSEATP